MTDKCQKNLNFGTAAATTGNRHPEVRRQHLQDILYSRLMAAESEHKGILRKNVTYFSYLFRNTISHILYRHQNAAQSLNIIAVNNKFENVGR